MPTRHSSAVWKGGLKSGKGLVTVGTVSYTHLTLPTIYSV